VTELYKGYDLMIIDKNEPASQNKSVILSEAKNLGGEIRELLQNIKSSKILRFAQDDGRFAQDDGRFAQDDDRFAKALIVS
jgi:hypothetical protein